MYFHSDKSQEGVEIVFEDNNQTRDAQSRVHAKLLDSLLQELLTGKFRDTHWFTGIQVHRE